MLGSITHSHFPSFSISINVPKTSPLIFFPQCKPKFFKRKLSEIPRPSFLKLPLDVVLVRHGESEGNFAQKYSKNGDHSYWTPEFSQKHTSHYRLTDKGREQAKIAGDWIRENISPKFEGYYTSEYARARETAALLDLPDALWFSEFYLREKDKGIISSKSYKDRLAHELSGLLDHYKMNAFYGAPPGGESVAETCLRVDWILELWRHRYVHNVVAVCHGNIMMAFRVRLEKMSQERFHEIDKSEKSHDEIFNCGILHYTRRNPHTGEIADFPNWMRSVCPWDLSLSSNQWQQIVRPTYTNEQLLSEVNKIPRYLEGHQAEFKQDDEKEVEKIRQ